MIILCKSLIQPTNDSNVFVYYCRKADPQQAISCLGKAIEIYTDMGRFTIAAKHHITIAEICEQDIVETELVRDGIVIL